VVVAALCIKAILPAGLMIDQRTLTVSICAESLGMAVTRTMAIPMKDWAGGDKQSGKDECPYASLAMASLTGADPVLLAAALGFILALGFAPVRLPRVERAPRLRPPLRGPPALI
jgi:hypothetical protein